MSKDKRLCITTLMNKLRQLNPGMFTETNADKYMLTMSVGKVLPKVVIERLLKEAASRLGQDPHILPSRSLRAGGCAAMYNTLGMLTMKFRNVWVSNCWKICVLSGRHRDNEAANRMTEADSDLMATMGHPGDVDFPT